MSAKPPEPGGGARVAPAGGTVALEVGESWERNPTGSTVPRIALLLLLSDGWLG
ncbi:MAG: hypothetical protein Q8P18_15570 [Pseudomonadota bacterium]|nr:hypothetical protein [Pseudomonadota bacterium]